MTRRVSAIADAGYILVLPTNFIVLVSSGFRVAHISAEGKTKSNSSEMRAQNCLSTFFVSIVVSPKWPEQVIRKV